MPINIIENTNATASNARTEVGVGRYRKQIKRFVSFPSRRVEFYASLLSYIYIYTSLRRILILYSEKPEINVNYIFNFFCFFVFFNNIKRRKYVYNTQIFTDKFRFFPK